MEILVGSFSGTAAYFANANLSISGWMGGWVGGSGFRLSLFIAASFCHSFIRVHPHPLCLTCSDGQIALCVMQRNATFCEETLVMWSLLYF